VARGKTALVYVLPALAMMLAWIRIERPYTGLARALVLVVFALLPALVRPLRLRLLVLLGVVLYGGWAALDTSLLEPGKLFWRLGNGALEFYDVTLPFNPHDHPRMQGAALVALFAFCLALAFALARRRALLAGLVVVVGAGWPGTLLRGGNVLLLGGLILVAVLVILMGLRPRSGRALMPAVVAGGLIVACALALASSPAIAKGEFLHWEGWDLYTKPERAVSISYVWNSDYRGLNWPKKATTVLKIAAPKRSFYWRATTLDAYVGGNWIEDLKTRFAASTDGRADLSDDSLLPRRARNSFKWVRQQVVVAALEDRHLVGADDPVAYAPGSVGSVSYARGGIALVVPGTDRGKSYAVWSYVPHPTPAQLARSKPIYPASISEGDYLTVDKGVYVPPFGRPGREHVVAGVISSFDPAYYLLYQEAKRVVGKAPDPYAAVVGLESWLRDSGRFRYDEHPPSAPGVPALVSFVTKTRRGYCQHFAGAMTLMLRYLGIPARVAAGFTSGKYDAGSGTWTVSDRDAHAWVEVWFRGYGWLPFDPTPGRGQLAASYSASSKSFDASAAAALVGPGAGALRSLLESRARAQGNGQSARGERARSVPTPAFPDGNRGLRLLGLFALVLAGIGLALYLGKLALRRSRYLTRDPRRIAAGCRRELVEFLLDQRIEVPRSATLSDLAGKIDSEFDVAADAFVDAAGSARFGAPAAADEAARRTRRELRRLEHVLRRRLGLFDRLVGALSLRSLRSA
jgi:transglutaminase-like putative cysteine protease